MAQSMKVEQEIIGFRQDEFGDWIAILSCGHQRHIRHNPPWTNHPWVLTATGRQEFLGVKIECKPCTEKAVV